MRNYRARPIRLAAALAFMAVGLTGAANAQQTPAPRVMHLSVTGVVDPLMADYVEGGIARAQNDGSAAVLLTIDTPGGLGSSMRQIVQAVLNTRVPVICFVSPDGARAASAGAFILLACPVAAMAPGTNVGAATPVGVSGAVLTRKVTEDAVASIRSIAERRGRNADLAEAFVRDAVSVSAQEALDRGMIDLIEPSRADLLTAIDGRTIDVGGGGTVTLHTAGAEVVDRGMSPGAAFLHALFDPNLAFIFFWVGLVLIVIELLVPGFGVAGILGGLMLISAFVSFGMLPVRVLGVLLLIASVIAFLVELKVPGIGAATAVGVAFLVAGGLFLFDDSIPSAQVSLWVIGTMAVLVTLFFGFVVTAALRMRRGTPVQGPERIVGLEGVVLGSGLGPEGIVRVAAEEWKAVASGGEPIPPGARVRVAAMDGLRLTVEPADVHDGSPVGSAEPGMRGKEPT